ncbi:hypothetical protein MSAN_02084500 [Mycena sanguinolenta]|uniref:Uncharacterized protein n=1 Tax=Mycena sanguinolenta TaxID=230812 RepID=A0A8H7CM08_9AGAR|nr:hypothetical protein MSAN_02084500 [Mycena sanguinolenta]
MAYMLPSRLKASFTLFHRNEKKGVGTNRRRHNFHQPLSHTSRNPCAPIISRKELEFSRVVMPFATDTQWPEGLLTIFTVSRRGSGSPEDWYSGPYDKMLNYCFGDGFDFIVARQAPPAHDSGGNLDFLVHVLVLDKNCLPVLLLVVKDDTHLHNPSKRGATDIQMRFQYDQLLHRCPLPTLYGLSLLGTKMRVYTGNTVSMKVNPPSVEQPARGAVDSSFLADQWDLDILSHEGFLKMKEIVDFIKEHSGRA